MKNLLFTFIIFFCCGASYSQHLGLSWGRTFGSIFQEYVMDVEIHGTSVISTGNFQSTVDFDPGPGVLNIASSGQEDIFVQKLNSTGNLVWVRTIGNSGLNSVQKIAVDNNGNSIIGGFYTGTMDCNPGSGDSSITAVSEDAFLIKLDANGNFIWAANFTSTMNATIEAVCVAPNGDVYAGGHFSGQIDLDPSPNTDFYTSAGVTNAFIVKLDPSGVYQWGEVFSSPDNVNISAIKVSSSGDIFTTGSFDSTVDFNLQPGGTNEEFRTTAGEMDIFINAMNPFRQHLWTYTTGGSNFDFGTDLDIDAAGIVYAVGSFTGNVDFDPNGTGNVLGNGGTDPSTYIMALNPTGNPNWTIFQGGAGIDKLNSIEVTQNSELLLAGSFQFTVDFDPSGLDYNLSNNGGWDAFIQKLDLGGSFKWAYSFGGGANEESISATEGPNGGIYLAARFPSNGIDIDPSSNSQQIFTNGGGDVLIARYFDCSSDNLTPSIATLPNISGQCAVEVSDIPYALNDCGDSIAGTTSDPLFYNQEGNYVIVWEYEFGSTTISQNQTVEIMSTVSANSPAPICINNGLFNLNNAVSTIGGIFEGNGLVNNNTFDPQEAGVGSHTYSYAVFVASEGCFDSAFFDITVYDVPTASMSATDAGCSDSTGTASVSVNGGTSPYTYYWNTGADSLNLSGLPPGLYNVTVTDNNGCMTNGVANVGNTSVTLAGTVGNATCFGGNDGSIDLTITGTGPHNILWSNGMSTEDITGLSKGPYDVTVIDANGCEATGTYFVGSASEIQVGLTLGDASCGSSDGTASASASGGTAPYTISYFDDQNNPLNPPLNTLDPGSYIVNVIDNLGCEVTENFVISATGGPMITLNQTTNASCNDDGSIDISISTPGSITSINWSNGEMTEDISNLAPGLYTVEVEDNSGCISLLDVTVEPQLPATTEICVVTVDSVTTTNLIVWEKPVSTSISHFNIYREGSQLGLYQKIDSVLYTDDSEYNDQVASPMVKSWRYKISTVDNCGNESALSDYHKTIHMTINQGLGGNINLIWDAYEGLTYTSFNCWRHTNSNGFELLWTNPSNIFSYTDIPPSMGGLDYVIGFDLPAPCTSSLLKAQDYNGTRSNRSAGVFNGSGLGIEESDLTDFDINLFPNPNNGSFRVHITGISNGNFDYQILDTRGRMVSEGTKSNRVFDLNLNTLERGIYYMNIWNNGVVNTQKIVIQ